MSTSPNDQVEMMLQFRKELDSLRAENQSLRQELTEVRQQNSQVIDPELIEALEELCEEPEGEGAFNSAEAKKELSGLLDDLEEMIGAMNEGTGMGLKMPKKIDQIRESLK